jgi:hypothetical protein
MAAASKDEVAYRERCLIYGGGRGRVIGQTTAERANITLARVGPTLRIRLQSGLQPDLQPDTLDSSRLMWATADGTQGQSFQIGGTLPARADFDAYSKWMCIDIDDYLTSLVKSDLNPSGNQLDVRDYVFDTMLEVKLRGSDGAWRLRPSLDALQIWSVNVSYWEDTYKKYWSQPASGMQCITIQEAAATADAGWRPRWVPMSVGVGERTTTMTRVTFSLLPPYSEFETRPSFSILFEIAIAGQTAEEFKPTARYIQGVSDRAAMAT